MQKSTQFQTLSAVSAILYKTITRLKKKMQMAGDHLHIQGGSIDLHGGLVM